MSKVYRLECEPHQAPPGGAPTYYRGARITGTGWCREIREIRCYGTLVCAQELHRLFKFSPKATGVTLCCSKTKPQHKQAYKFRRTECCIWLEVDA